jgi:iron complex outermembrane receptor protein
LQFINLLAGVGDDAEEDVMRSLVFFPLFCLFAMPAGAQNDDAVVITATRFPDSKRNLAIGVSVITAEDIRASASANLAEILAQYGLLHVRDNAGSPNQQLDLRGFGITGSENTLVLVDGVRLSENELVAPQLSQIPLDSIERIEILRGSGGVLYGGGTSGGTINIITRGPSGVGEGAGQRRASVLGRAGGWGTREVRAGYSSQGEVLGFSLAFSDEDTKGYRRNNRFQQTNVSGVIEARFDAARAWLRFGVDDQHQGLPGALSEAQIMADPRQSTNPFDYGERNGGHVVLGGSVKSGRHEFSADLAMRRKHADALLFNGTFFVDTRAKYWAFTPRAKLGFDAFGRAHELVLGADVDRWQYDTASAGSPQTISTPFSRRAGEMSNEALYGQLHLWLGEATRLVAGSRVQRNDDRLEERVFPLDDRRAARTLRAHELALRHRLGGGWSAYGKLDRSFRIANFDDNACFFPPCGATLLEPQTSHAAELGAEFERGRWRGRAALYQMRLENEIYFSPLTFSTLNLSPTERRGLELEASWRALEALELRASLALQRARFRSGVYGGTDVSGNEVPLVPRSLFTAGASWRIDGRTRLNANLRHVGEQRYDNDQANTFPRRMPAYGLLDLKLEHRIERTRVALEIRNLFDKHYYSYGIRNGAGTSFNAFPAPGRATVLSAAFQLD